MNAKTTPRKKESGQTENRIVAMSRSVFLLQLVNESNIDQLIDRTKKLVHASHADGAVDIAILVPYSDLHTLVFDGFFRASVQSELFRDLPIEPRYIFADEQGGFHITSPDELVYVRKYFIKVSI